VRDGGRLAAAIAVLEDMAARHAPARLALRAWGEGARYAGAKDRAVVSGLVLDALRRRRSLGFQMNEETERARVLGLARDWGWSVARIEAAAGEAHGPGALSEAERTHLEGPFDLNDAPVAVRGDFADWLEPHMTRAFNADAAAEGEALARRAPIDVRVNTLKIDVTRGLKALEVFNAHPAGLSPTAVRIDAPLAGERAPPIETLPEFAKGWFEIQDLGSQAVAALAGDIAHHQVLDLCAGGGGKTLALAAAMANTGQLYAYDADARRLADTQRRAIRAGVRNLQVRSPLRPDALADLGGRMDLVFIDAPCSGSGVWRRHPDAKWRFNPAQLERRMAEQDAVLAEGAVYVKPGGEMIYVTCSLFREENEDRIAAFLSRNRGFAAEPITSDHVTEGGFLRLTPRTAGTDGFFAAVLRRMTSA
jgi:16S rRNA (cytosine967-C5)-methyltransferase